MKLIVGLGNPGKKYEDTRHNAGFMVMDALASYYNVKIEKAKFESLYSKIKINGEDVVLLKPQTYMNNSGIAIKQAMKFFKIDIKDVLIIYDDLDTKCGEIRLKTKGSSGGHNGVKSIINHLGTSDFNRIRVGIDRDMNILIVDYVLQRFSKADKQLVSEAVVNAVKVVSEFLESGDFVKTINACKGGNNGIN